MNYTGRPSISGCRPVLSLYPTHRFCQYLLLIFITFTNSFLFNRAFSTNSRRPLSQRLPLWERSSTSPSLLRNATARVAAPSVCFAVARILLAAAPTAPPCFRHWRRSSPLLLPRGGLGIAENFSSSPEAPLLGELASEARLRGWTKENPTVSTKKDPLSEIGAPGGGLSFWVSQWTHLLLPLSLLLYAILRKSQALCGKFTVTLLFGIYCIFLSKFMI